MKTISFTQIKETCLYFENIDLARDFYAGLLGLEVISYVLGKHIFFRAGNSVLLCFNPADSSRKKSPPPHYSNGKYHFALEVQADEYESCKKEMEGRGVIIIDKVIWRNGQESFYFHDPIGNVIEIVPTGIWD